MCYRRIAQMARSFADGAEHVCYLGVKRTSPICALKSANDPKRTSAVSGLTIRGEWMASSSTSRELKRPRWRTVAAWAIWTTSRFLLSCLGGPLEKGGLLFVRAS